MLKAMNNLKRQAGISLLELMLSLAIIAVVLTMATRFFNQVNVTQNLNNAVSMANGVVASLQTYRLNVKEPVPNPTLAVLYSAGQLPGDIAGPSHDGTKANPWGGNIVLSTEAGKQAFVEFTNVPYVQTGEGDAAKYSGTCEKLAARLSVTYPSAKCTGGTVHFDINE